MDKILEQFLDTLLSLSSSSIYGLVFAVLLACGIGLPIPEDITLFTGGLLAYYGKVKVFNVIVIAFAGVMMGDSIIFWLGQKYGRRLTKKWFFARFLPQERLDVVSHKLKKQGNKIIFAARFMPGLRAPVYFTCGTLHVPFRVFFFFDGLAALISVPAIVYAVYYFGDQIHWIIKVIKKFQFGIVSIILAIIFGMIIKGIYDRWQFRREEAKSKKKHVPH